MTTPERQTGHVLYGVPRSLCTGIARCHLRTQGIGYSELPPGHPVDRRGHVEVWER